MKCAAPGLARRGAGDRNAGADQIAERRGVDVPPPRVRALLAQIAELPVDAVLGHHPHVLQGAERRGRMLVLYSLGDAVFNCHAGDFTAEVAAQRRLESGVFTLRFAHDAHGLMFEPTRLDPDGIPGAASGGQAVRWESLCEALADADAHFREVGAPMLLKYELQSLMTYVRQGRWDRVVRLLGAIRPRHLSTLWMAIARGRSGIRRGEST